MSSLLRRFLDLLAGRSEGDRLLFKTTRAPFQAPEWAAGRVVVREDGTFRVTRWVEQGRIGLSRGGSVHEWEVRGVPVSEEEISADVIDEAERILRRRSREE